MVFTSFISRLLNWFRHGFQHSRPDLSAVDDTNHAARSFEEWKDDEWGLYKKNNWTYKNSRMDQNEGLDCPRDLPADQYV